MTSETPALPGVPGARLDTNDFELFGLAARFAQQRAVLDTRRKELQAQVHPDRFVAHGAAAQRVAMQWAMRVNEAYDRLKSPLLRAAYLCELNGQPVDAETHSAMSMQFLTQQMDWREALDRAAAPDLVENLAADVAAHRCLLEKELAVLMDERGDWGSAVDRIRELMFITRFAEEVQRRLDAIGE